MISKWAWILVFAQRTDSSDSDHIHVSRNYLKILEQTTRRHNEYKEDWVKRRMCDSETLWARKSGWSWSGWRPLTLHNGEDGKESFSISRVSSWKPNVGLGRLHASFSSEESVTCTVTNFFISSKSAITFISWCDNIVKEKKKLRISRCDA